MPKKLEFVSPVDSRGEMPQEKYDIIETHLTLFAGSKVKVSVGPAKRTLSQNKMLHGYVIEPIRQRMHEVGLGPISHEALHAYFRDLLLEPKVEEVFGEEKLIRPSTTRLNSTEFHYYCEQIKNLEMVRQLGVQFPELDEDPA